MNNFRVKTGSEVKLNEQVCLLSVEKGGDLFINDNVAVFVICIMDG